MVKFLGSSFVKKVDRTAKGKPQTLFKRANLGYTYGRQIIFTPLVSGVEVKANDDAVCANGLSHAAPSRVCGCGFYAYTAYEDAEAHEQGGDVILKVVASGKMFQYSKGYRYEHQRVEQVEVKNCHWCPKSAYRFAMMNGRLTPICRMHAANVTTMSFHKFEALASLGLPSHAPKIKVKAEVYESPESNAIHFLVSERVRKLTIATLAGAAFALGLKSTHNRAN